VRDGVFTRLIGQWLKAGVMEDGRISYPDYGSPQGDVLSRWRPTSICMSNRSGGYMSFYIKNLISLELTLYFINP
jgi:hypothetical protein